MDTVDASIRAIEDPLLSPTPSPPLILPSTAHKDDLPEADMPLQKRACFTAPTPRRFKVGESSTATGQPGSTMACRDAQDDCAALRDEVGTLRRYLSSLCTTHEQGERERESSETRQALASSEAHNRALEARIATMETQLYRMDADDHVTRAMMPIRYSLLSIMGNSQLAGCRDFVSFVDIMYGMELTLLCGRMFPKESDKVEKYVDGLPDIIQGSVMASKPNKMQDAIDFATEPMDQKIRTLAERQAENKRKFEDTSRNNQNQQQPFKRHNVARAYTARPGEKKLYGGSKPLCPKCNYHHEGQCAPRCNKCKKGHYKKDCPKLRNKNRGNQVGNGNAVARVYAMGTAGTNPNSNVVTGTFLLNNRYASILSDTGVDRSFVSTAFSSLIDIVQTTLDHGYNVELADGIPRVETWNFQIDFGYSWYAPVVRELLPISSVQEDRIVTTAGHFGQSFIYDPVFLTLGGAPPLRYCLSRRKEDIPDVIDYRIWNKLTVKNRFYRFQELMTLLRSTSRVDCQLKDIST
ncbi:hypothetical protein Tco_0887252 [Tanacetum coccineum]